MPSSARRHHHIEKHLHMNTFFETGSLPVLTVYYTCIVVYYIQCTHSRWQRYSGGVDSCVCVQLCVYVETICTNQSVHAIEGFA